MAEDQLLKRKFVYRIFLLFICCAIVPLMLLAIVSIYQVTSQLKNNAQDRLHSQATNLGMSAIERFSFAEAEIDLISSNLVSALRTDIKEFPANKSDFFIALAAISHEGSSWMDIVGSRKHWPMLDRAQKDLLTAGKTLIFTQSNSGTSASIFMCKNKIYNDGKIYTLFAEIQPHYLLGVYHGEEETFGPTNVSIIEGSRIIFTTLTENDARSLLRGMSRNSSITGNMVWGQRQHSYLASSIPVFLKSRHEGPLWTLVLSESTDDVFKPVDSFRYTFILILAFALFAVLLLSLNQIRRKLVPLERLREGTLKVSQGDLSSRMVIRSGDEFEGLAESFNAMVDQLQQQFNTLNTMANLDRSILSEFDFEKIIDTFFHRINDVCPSEAAGVCFRYQVPDEKWNSHYKILSEAGHAAKKVVETVFMNEEDLVPLRNKGQSLVLVDEGPLPRFLKPLAGKGIEAFLVMPVIVDVRLMAMVFLAGEKEELNQEGYQVHARQITDRIGVAFSNASLINELHILNAGTIKALARVVDAKSPWTAGHSERVAAMAYKIGEALGLDRYQLNILNKAGLLHDIGKVSTPEDILNKVGKLTDEEYDVIKEHPAKGARILEPIVPFAEIIPIVLQHHERFDGKGYPNQCSGSNLVLGARILAVADSYDAMISERPYRKGMNIKDAIAEVKQQAGRQFDPDVVQTFLRVMEQYVLEEKSA